MPHLVTLHQGMHCLLRQNRSTEKISFGDNNMWPHDLHNGQSWLNCTVCIYLKYPIRPKRKNTLKWQLKQIVWYPFVMPNDPNQGSMAKTHKQSQNIVPSRTPRRRDIEYKPPNDSRTKLKQTNHLSLPHHDDFTTKKGTKVCTQTLK